ncbi:MAG: serine/threonine-protein kinase [Vulcanimicrobiota bacterium]
MRSEGIRQAEPPVKGRYRLQYLARGGMALAYRARLGERQLFLKESPLAQSQHLRHEAQMLQRLPLGQFPRFVELFEEDGYLYLVTEFLEGQTLEQEVESNPWSYPEESELRDLSLQLCRQLEILHERKILYLDLKPGNLIRTPQGKIYLVDFGIAQVSLAPVALGQYQGSPWTASPEHYTGKVERRSDLFSLAATVHYVATRGQCPRNPQAPFSDASQVHPSLSPHFAQWLARCLELNPLQRFQDISAARLALEQPEKPSSGPSWKRWLGLSGGS